MTPSAEDVDRDTGDDVVDAEGDGGDRVQQTAERAAERCRRSTPSQGPDWSAGPGAEPGAEDHHAFEADVDDARPLGPQAAETGEADRHGQLERGADLAGGGERRRRR